MFEPLNDPEVGLQVVLSFERGTLVLDPREAFAVEGDAALPPGFLRDPRAGGRLRAPAIDYRRALAWLIRAGYEVDDQARAYEELTLVSRRRQEPYPHQAEALAAWQGSGRRGVVVLPTGAGKTHVAELALACTQRSTLVVAPTIDLMNQWVGVLETAFGVGRVGSLGGGSNDVRPLTVSTYDSAYLHAERLGARFGLLVFDECHHLPSPSYAQAAQLSIAPFRLGLTATPERRDGSDAALDALIGPVVYRKDIQDLAGRFLADYETIRLAVCLPADAREAYEQSRWAYRSFVEAAGIRLSAADGWQRFLAATSRSQQGRIAWRAWREQRRIAMQGEGKLELLAELLERHAAEQVIVFTADNETVYAISRRPLVPAITHQTPAAERREVLRAYNAGELRVIVTSRVLNEGVDMPAASVGVVLSGSSSVREHVQRLGRILRKRAGKTATLYEVITEGTTEESTSERRREHSAYR